MRSIEQVLGLVQELLEEDGPERFTTLEILGDVFEQTGCKRPRVYWLYWTSLTPDEVMSEEFLVEDRKFISAAERKIFLDRLLREDDLEKIRFGFRLHNKVNHPHARWYDVVWEERT